jgi:hypothetical protein
MHAQESHGRCSDGIGRIDLMSPAGRVLHRLNASISPFGRARCRVRRAQCRRTRHFGHDYTSTWDVFVTSAYTFQPITA